MAGQIQRSEAMLERLVTETLPAIATERDNVKDEGIVKVHRDTAQIAEVMGSAHAGNVIRGTIDLDRVQIFDTVVKFVLANTLYDPTDCNGPADNILATRGVGAFMGTEANGTVTGFTIIGDPERIYRREAGDDIQVWVHPVRKTGHALAAGSRKSPKESHYGIEYMRVNDILHEAELLPPDEKQTIGSRVHFSRSGKFISAGGASMVFASAELAREYRFRFWNALETDWAAGRVRKNGNGREPHIDEVAGWLDGEIMALVLKRQEDYEDGFMPDRQPDPTITFHELSRLHDYDVQVN